MNNERKELCGLSRLGKKYEDMFSQLLLSGAGAAHSM
jgi:hypothetical protein